MSEKAAETPATGAPAIQPWLREILRCPAGRHELRDAISANGEPVLECVEECPQGVEAHGATSGRLQFGMPGGIPDLLIDDAVVVPSLAG